MWEYYLMGIILIPGLILASWASYNVQSTFNTYNKLDARSGITASELIRRLLAAAGMGDVSVTLTRGNLTDHYDPKHKTIALSEDTYNSTSVSALGVACHEFGHALQNKDSYAPLRVRQTLIPITNFASSLLMPLVIIGLMFCFGSATNSFVGNIFLWSGIIVFGSSVFVNLVTLPVEYDASNRAMKLLSATGTLTESELKGAKKVLNAAALTYVASLLVSILSLLRFLLVALSRRNRD